MHALTIIKMSPLTIFMTSFVLGAVVGYKLVK